MNIVFMGTPDFAAVCLESIISSEHNVTGVVTAPDRQKGRGRKISESAVKRVATEHGIPLAQPEKLKAKEFHEVLRGWNADLFVVVAFRMLPEVVWAMPPKGTINLHASLLPQFRGAAPIQRAIMQGATESGATVFRLTDKIDTGNILSSISLEIGPNENAGSLHDRILNAGKVLLVEALDTISNGNDVETPQESLINNDIDIFEAPKIFKEDRRIDWTKSTEVVHNTIRGLSPYPGAFTVIEGSNEPYKILDGKTCKKENLKAGETLVVNSKLYVGTCDGCYEITKLQPAGKPAMDTSSFARGLREELGNFS